MNYQDKVKGLIFGGALGDCFGAYFEMRNENMILKDYPNSLDVDFPPSKPVSFMKRDPKQHWTDDTSQMILLMETLVEGENIFNVNIFAKKLVYWMNNGFSELNETRGVDIGCYTCSVLGDPDYLQNPLSVSLKCSKSTGNVSNGSLMRTAIMAARGCNNKISRKRVLIDAMVAGRATHYNSRCTRFVKIYTDLVWSVLNDCEPVFLKDDMYKELDDIVLDDTHTGYVLKTFAVAVWAYFHIDGDFKDNIKKIILKGGNADTNACVSGALLGSRIGYTNLPRDWVEKMPHWKWLEERVDKFIEVIMK
jgi:ADP-ribosylglycohydrolase